MSNMYVDLIMKSKYYEDCLKASSEFGIPLVVVDKTYYFNKLLAESVAYDEETMSSISKLYSHASEPDKKRMFNMVACGKDSTKIMQSKEPNKISISF